MLDRQQGHTAVPWTFFMADAANPAAGKTGLAPTVALSKNGNAFAAPVGAVAEIGHGWYAFAPAAADVDTPGDLLLHAEADGAIDFDGRFGVVNFDPFDGARLGLTALATPKNITVQM